MSRIVNFVRYAIGGVLLTIAGIGFLVYAAGGGLFAELSDNQELGIRLGWLIAIIIGVVLVKPLFANGTEVTNTKKYASHIQRARRLSIGLMTVAGALMFTAINVVTSTAGGPAEYFAVKAATSIPPLGYAALTGLIGFFLSEVADLDSTPEEGHPHSKRNYVETIMTMIGLTGFLALLYGGARLVGSVAVLPS